MSNFGVNEFANIINGSDLAVGIRARVKAEIEELVQRRKAVAAKEGIHERHELVPGLGIVLVGTNPASEIYIRNKMRAAESVGIVARLYRFEEDITTEDLVREITKLNNYDSISGIIVQMPLPSHIDKAEIINAIDPAKDVDGFHPENVGTLYSGIGQGFIPCTALGCLEMIKSVHDDIAGMHAVIVGRSNIVGRPLAALLLQQDCTVTIAHSRTKDLANLTREADIVVSAVGNSNFLTKDYFQAGATVIDVGINRIELENKCEIVGDVDFMSVKDHVKYISPVPGGVGPMTVAFLLVNCLEAHKRKLEQ